jgi:hypothetical protein
MAAPELLEGSYDCVDRIALRAYFRLGQTSGGFLTWWNRLFPDRTPSQECLRRMAGDFARRVKVFSEKHEIPLQYCEIGDKNKFAMGRKGAPQRGEFSRHLPDLGSKGASPGVAN